MFGELLSGFVDIQAILTNNITKILLYLKGQGHEGIPFENNKDFCVLIKPKDANSEDGGEIDFDLFLCRYSSDKGVSTPLRKLSKKHVADMCK